MKARSLVLIMLFCMMSFTGFGNTTADLTENSNLETLTDAPEVSINVVSLAAPQVAPAVIHTLSKDLSMTPEMHFAELVKVADLAFNDQYKAELAPLAVPPDLITALTNLQTISSQSHKDVGWRLYPADRLRFLCFHSS